MADTRSDTGNVSHYYDSAVGERLADFVYANPRMEGALRFAARWMPAGAGSILDVGCGIGWSTAWAQARCPGARVVGVDLSPDGIRAARALFSADGPTYLCRDVAAPQDADTAGPFDVVLMVDVWEHVPAARRGDLNRVLGERLTGNGCIIATFPSAANQRWLRQHQPGRLQPVDEEIADEVVDRLCRDARLSLVHRETAGIWRPDDYVRLVLARPGYRAPGDRAPEVDGPEPGRRVPERAARVERSLGFSVTRHGAMLPQRGGLRVALFCEDVPAAATPGVRSHVEPLQAKVDLFAGPRFDRRPDGARLLSFRYWHRVRRVLSRAVHPDLPADWFERRALVRYLERGGYNVALAEGGAAAAAVAGVCREAGLPLLVRFLGPDAYCAAEAVLREVFEQAAALVVPARAMAGRLAALGAPEGKVHCIPPGVDCSRIRAADPAANPPVFVGAGAFVPRKGHHLAILSFRKLLDEHPDSSLVLFGDGPLLGPCRDLAEALGLGSSLQLPGQGARATVLHAMAGARAFVQHSVTARDGDTEGVPLAILEAGASGLPVVGTRHGGIPEAVVEDETGLLVPEGDVDGMAAHMLTLAADPGCAGRLGAAARARVNERYDRAGAAADLLHILNGVSTNA